MFTSGKARQFLSAMRRTGERITVKIDGAKYYRKAVVQNAGKNFMRKYDDGTQNKRDLGNSLERDKIAFLPYFPRWELSKGDIIIRYRRKDYLVVADSVMNFGEEPFYIWALLREVSSYAGKYYKDIEK